MPSYVKFDRIVRNKDTKIVPKIDIHFAFTPSNWIASIMWSSSLRSKKIVIKEDQGEEVQKQSYKPWTHTVRSCLLCTWWLTIAKTIGVSLLKGVNLNLLKYLPSHYKNNLSNTQVSCTCHVYSLQRISISNNSYNSKRGACEWWTTVAVSDIDSQKKTNRRHYFTVMCHVSCFTADNDIFYRIRDGKIINTKLSRGSPYIIPDKLQVK